MWMCGNRAVFSPMGHETQFRSVAPAYRVNFREGYIGFTYSDKSVLSMGIAYFTRWSRLSDIPVAHALVVSGPETCIEALKKDGVCEQPLDKYFSDENTRVSFRKPVGYTAALGMRIAAAARDHLGAAYDTPLLLAQLLDGSFLGRLLSHCFGEDHHEKVSRLFNSADRWICSELAAYALDAQPELTDRGILAKPDEAIEPQELFEDNEIFCPWDTSCSAQPGR